MTNKHTCVNVLYRTFRIRLSVLYPTSNPAFFLVTPNESLTIDELGSPEPKEGLSPMLVALIAVVGALVAIFVVVILVMKKKLDDKSRDARYATYVKTARQEEVYDFVDENMVNVQW